jgi:hypothetical protein
VGLILAAALSLGVAACSDGGSSAPDPAAVQRALIDREGLTAAEAGCVTRFLEDGYEDDALQLLVDEGIESLPSPLWGEYVISMLTCTMGDELTGDGADPSS